MTTFKKPLRWPTASGLTFTPYAWGKLLYMLHAAHTEVAGFGLTSASDLLAVHDFVLVPQEATAASFEFDDVGLADYQIDMGQGGYSPEECMRIWIHTHPGASASPSGVDEDTCLQVFQKTGWGVMMIISETEETYARLMFSAGPGGRIMLPVTVDWSENLYSPDPEAWKKELAENVKPAYTGRVQLWDAKTGTWKDKEGYSGRAGWNSYHDEHYGNYYDWPEASHGGYAKDTTFFNDPKDDKELTLAGEVEPLALDDKSESADQGLDLHEDIGLPNKSVDMLEEAIRAADREIPMQGSQDWWFQASLVWRDVFGGSIEETLTPAQRSSLPQDAQLYVHLNPFDETDISDMEAWAGETGAGDVADLYSQEWWDVWTRYVEEVAASP